MSTTGPARALIARGLKSAIILATDNYWLAREVSEYVGDSADDVLGDWFVPETPGFYLFEGKGKWTSHMTLDGPSDSELKWEGAVRAVLSEEIAQLLNMEPDCEIRLEERQ